MFKEKLLFNIDLSQSVLKGKSKMTESQQKIEPHTRSEPESLPFSPPAQLDQSQPSS